MAKKFAWKIPFNSFFNFRKGALFFQQLTKPTLIINAITVLLTFIINVWLVKSNFLNRVKHIVLGL